MFSVRVKLLCATLALAPTYGPAQEAVPEANPARPTVSTPATLTPIGYLQFENGWQYAANSSEFYTQFSLNQVTKLTVTSRLQLMELVQPFAYSKIATQTDNSPGDLCLGVQAVALKGNAHRPTLATSYIRRIYEGPAANVDIGSFEQSATLLLSADPWGFHVDANGIISEQVAAPLRRAQFGQTLSISHPIRRFTLAGEIWHFSQPLSRGNAVGNLWAVSYPMQKNLILDAGFNHGLTSTSTHWEGFAGFTYLLPHRLWKAPKSTGPQ